MAPEILQSNKLQNDVDDASSRSTIGVARAIGIQRLEEEFRCGRTLKKKCIWKGPSITGRIYKSEMRRRR